ncbi:class I SAM-dependent methyltransferase [Pseudomonas gingeri]|uniref:class I SAM-dependent methyltransferase n=1 Tax=Pseudomonas gingeri TaxID=117681 RepID=UPI00159FD88A|nr:class I SAM-dependent methyltransferase [Pseudomonas gingeri]NWD04843.1 class I SAM-dependent methyltransferase [Pseudomonas gingeri]NWE30791.1 class I SAM-dependent methyltransferase [Pseudomonas gingeri]NWE58853.1 class I SAM-dependent methyltransferase [Pseudomonas gingeri]NWF02559.1 class I SAM-dependent methyltransferase [Pseudomonas gingeri]
MSGVHKAAQVGFSTEAKTYAQGRPDYPVELQSWLGDSLGIAANGQAIDLGAGTGKFTRLLVATGATVTAIEPVEAMRAELVARLPAVRALSGTAEAMPLESGVADTLLCAQAFHWFAHEAALAEIHRVLKPGGRLGLVWNVRDESVDWVAAITRIITPYEGDTPRFHTGAWRKPFTGRYFSAPELSCLGYTHVGTAREVIIDRFMSVSFIAALPPAEKAQVGGQLQELIDTHPALRGRESIAFPYRTEAYRCMRVE